jgi:hypothetical protein
VIETCRNLTTEVLGSLGINIWYIYKWKCSEVAAEENRVDTSVLLWQKRDRHISGNRQMSLSTFDFYDN